MPDKEDEPIYALGMTVKYVNVYEAEKPSVKPEDVKPKPEPKKPEPVAKKAPAKKAAASE